MTDSLHALSELVAFLQAHTPLCVITGAGCSTPSGIYDYRDATGNWKRPQPVYLHDFLSKPSARREYWSRSMLGYPRFMQAKPNVIHRALAELETAGAISSVVTQNVDSLHEDAGQQSVIKLHGTLATVSCLDCGIRKERSAIQKILEEENRFYLAHVKLMSDGGESQYTVPIGDDFQIPDCENCGGILKPDVVFFGDSVPTFVKVEAQKAVVSSRGLLVLGTSCQVFSCFRLVQAAYKCSIPIASINLGRTRADQLLAIKLNASLETVIPKLVQTTQIQEMSYSNATSSN